MRGNRTRPAVDQRHPPAAAEDPEHGVGLGHPQVAPQRQLEATGDGVARHRGNHRLGQHQPARAHRRIAVGRQPVRLAGRDGL